MTTNNKDYTPAEFAKLIHRHYNTVYRWMLNGKIPAYKLVGRWFIPHNALEQIKAKGSNIQERE